MAESTSSSSSFCESRSAERAPVDGVTTEGVVHRGSGYWSEAARWAAAEAEDPLPLTLATEANEANEAIEATELAVAVEPVAG